MGWPPAPGSAAARSTFPPAGWPSRGELEYVRVLIVVALLVLALPWLAVTLFSRPWLVLSGLGQKAAPG
jgi:hypothetical protein